MHQVGKLYARTDFYKSKDKKRRPEGLRIYTGYPSTRLPLKTPPKFVINQEWLNTHGHQMLGSKQYLEWKNAKDPPVIPTAPVPKEYLPLVREVVPPEATQIAPLLATLTVAKGRRVYTRSRASLLVPAVISSEIAAQSDRAPVGPLVPQARSPAPPDPEAGGSLPVTHDPQARRTSLASSPTQPASPGPHIGDFSEAPS